ncbi:MAG: DUF1670 domain-containing protein [Syntrophobacteria bacterium]
MKKRHSERRYKHLLEKDYQQALMAELALRFDFSKHSWICETIVTKFDTMIETWETSEGLHRLKPGELQLPYKDKMITIPLFTRKAAEVLMETKLFPPYRSRVIDKVLSTIRAIDDTVSEADVNALIYRRSLVPRCEKSIELETLEMNPTYPLINPKKLSIDRPNILGEKITLPCKIKDELISFCADNLGMKPFVATHALDLFLDLRARYLPLRTAVKPGQLVWLGTSFKKSKKVGCVQLERKQIPIILTLYTEEEIATIPQTLAELDQSMMQQLARVTTEAYLQEALLPADELQLFFLRPYTFLGKLMRSYMETNKVILPTPGSILDAGTMFTHKELIIDLSMEGYFTKEIAKKTCHDPKSVDSYLKTFNSVLVLWYYELPEELIATVTERGKSVIKQHLEIIKKYFPDRGAMKNYLNNRGYALG